MRRRVTFSRNVTLSLSRTCVSHCKYCAFQTHQPHLHTPDEVIAQLERCRCIVRMGAGYDSVDCDAATAKGILVCNVPAYCTAEVADHALALLLACLHDMSAQGYAYAVIGWTGPQEFYAKVCGATPIPDSRPGMYTGMLSDPQ